MSDYFDVHEQVPQPVVRASERVLTIRRIFGLGTESVPITLLDHTQVPKRGITLITGLSGSGKSTLLRRIVELRRDARSLPSIHDPSTPAADLLGGDIREAIRWMGQFGLGEARLMTTPFGLLSDGQKFRARLALLMWSRPSCIAIDEFLSVLDRLTARIVANNLQKCCRVAGVDAYLATAHDDLVDALCPDHLIEVELGGTSRTRPGGVPQRLAEIDEIEFGVGEAEDYRSLARYHYIEHLAAEGPLTETEWAESVSEVRVAWHRGRIVGAVVFSRPVPRALEQLQIFRRLNERAVVILRVIVHPLFRGVGLTKRLLQPEPKPGLRCIVTCSALGLYFPFFLGAGLERIDHPRNLRYPAHDALDSHLEHISEAERFDLNKYDYAQAFYVSQPESRRRELRRICSEICVRSNVDYCSFIAQLAGLEEPQPNLEDFFTRFFTQMVEQVPEEQFGTLLSEALYFSVQGFWRPLTEESP